MIRYRSTAETACRWAVFYLVSSVLATLRPLTVDLGLRISLTLVVYLTGLITQQNITATEIATQVGLVSHDSLRRMLAGLSLTISLGLTLSVRLIVALGGAPGWIAIDDVLLPKPFDAHPAPAGRLTKSETRCYDSDWFNSGQETLWQYCWSSR